MRDVVFLGDSLDVLREFPDGVRSDLGHGLSLVQNDIEPSN